MPIDAFTNADSVTILGPLIVKDDPTNASTGTGSVSLGNGSMTINSAGTFTGSGVQTVALSGGVSTLATIATSGTITVSGSRILRTTNAGAVTAVVLATGLFNGQDITIVNENTTGTNTITFAASGTSNVAAGTAVVISGLRCQKLVWLSANSLWYQS